jgi:cytochrome o ubiquinol oxidase subunit IV
MSKHKSEHGTVQSYVIGFILSLIFTFIPYYLVVNQTFSKKSLLIAILGFGLIQMVIQITFFLHLGRGPKPRWNLYFFISTFFLILVVVGGSIVIINNLHYNMQPSDQVKKLIADEGIYQVGGKETGACQQLRINHKVTISNGKVTPLHTDAHLCDTLTFINEDNTVRDIAFGPHPEHQNYAGVSEVTVRKGYPKTITLGQSGSQIFHDHLEETVTGNFNVTP